MHAKSVLKRLSCCHGAEKLSSKQTHISIKIATLSIASLLSFLSDKNKSIKKGENHFNSHHVEAFGYQQGVLQGEVHTSTKKKVYKFMVS